MTEEVQLHQTNTEMIKSASPEVEAGADMVLKVKVLCPSACDLRGKMLKILAQNGVVVAKEIELATFDGTANETDELVVKAPIKPREYAWTVLFPAQEVGGIPHQESSTPFAFIVKPHATSIAVWDVPSPITFKAKFKIKVGVKCSAGCQLAGKPIEVYDEKEAKVAPGRLGETPWQQTSGLYWTEVELAAPAAEGMYSWTARFPASELELPHEGISSSFNFKTGRPPEHTVTIEVIDKDTNTPIKGAYVLLNPRRAYSDESGVAKIEVSKGEYELYVSKDDYATFQTTVKVSDDVTIKVELLFVPELSG